MMAPQEFIAIPLRISAPPTFRQNMSLPARRASASSAPLLSDDAKMFELAPVSLWLEDYSDVKAHFDALRAAGIRDLRKYLGDDVERVKACAARIRVLRVNRRTLALYDADDLDHLVANLDSIFRDEMLTNLTAELCSLWEGKCGFISNGVNYALSGRRIDIQVNGSLLPGAEASWDRVLIAIEDVSEREQARRALAASEDYSRGLFEHSPISLWVEDFSKIRDLLLEARERGIEDFRVFTDVHPEFVSRCMSEIRVVDVNAHTLHLFGAPDKATLLSRLRDVFRGEMTEAFREQLIDLWNGKLFHQREIINYALDGTLLHLHLQFSVLPGHETGWSLVQVALTDISARKKAEAYLEYLGQHDVLTKLYNRAFFVDELNRLERKALLPVTIVAIDVNGLKAINDTIGHAAGDEILRRAGEVLSKLVEPPCAVARIGGDEFVVLMPGREEREGRDLIESIRNLVMLNNQFHSGPALSVSMGMATSRAGERLEVAVSRADAAMYADKREHYAAS